MTTKQKLILTLLIGSQFMLSIDFTILNVALPALGRDLRLGAAGLPWVSTAFALPSAGFTLLFGRLGDLLGRRRLFLAGLALLPAGFIVGALLGGVLTDFLSWRWAFLVNVPVCVVIAIAAPAVITERRQPRRARLDIPGAVSVTAGLVALVYGITAARQDGWGSAAALGTLAGSAVLLGAFVAVERRSPAPLASLAVLARATVKWGNLGGLILFSMSSAVVYLMTLYLQDILGFSPLVTGLAFAVPGVAAITAGIVAPRFIRRFGTRATLTAGIAVQGAAFAALLALGPQRAWLFLMLVAVGVSLFANVTGVVTYTVTATSGLPPGEQGLATGLTTMTQLVAITLGIPVIGAIAGSALSASAAPGAAALGSLHRGLAADVAINAVFAVVVWTGLRQATRAAAQPDAASAEAVNHKSATRRRAALNPPDRASRPGPE